ncbi:hypothetical protein PLICRDRAFT_141242 [Plicaturopsis crispa FD-325 SS-3]|nr:hypothetical protein PLICRDRAFT_141242 [Plicaturopsis crispa FD-325 SS-3]
MKVIPVPVRSDNYAYLLVDEPSLLAAAVDPYDVDKVRAAAEAAGATIVAALTTHHHNDHSGGNEKFAAAYPDAPIFGGSRQIPALTTLVKEGDAFTIGEGISVKCIATPCHTQDSICYHFTSPTSAETHPGGVFTGDTLFPAGCGRFFEGTGEQMHNSLQHLAASVPPSTLVYAGHEYTGGNVAFGAHIDPENPSLKRLAAQVKAGETVGKTTIGEETEWNVFMRLNSDAVLKATNSSESTPPSAVMDKLRELKNNFRG